MASIDQLLTLGLAHGADTTRYRAGFVQSSPDPNALRWEHVHQALVTLDVETRAALCLPAAGHLVTGAELAALVYVLQLRLLRKEPAGSPVRAYPELQARFVRAALAEFVDPRVCRTCKGAGQVLVHVEGQGVRPATCTKCAGKGWRHWSDNRRARECQVRRADWLPHYARPYTRVLDHAVSLRRAGAAQLRDRLYGSDGASEHDGLESRLQAGT